MVRAIFLGAFCPDAEGSQYFPFPPAPPASGPLNGTVKDDAAEAGTGPAEHDFCKVELPVTATERQEVVDLISESESSESESGDSCVASEDSFVLEPASHKAFKEPSS